MYQLRTLFTFDVGKRDALCSLYASARAQDVWMSGRILRVFLYVSEIACSAMISTGAHLTIPDYLAGGDWLDVLSRKPPLQVLDSTVLTRTRAGKV